MTTCSECIHNELCKNMHRFGIVDLPYNDETICEFFKPKSDYEHKHGHWHLLDECANEGVYCSVCHKKVYRVNYANQKIKSNFCPNCGAYMGKENNHEE